MRIFEFFVIDVLITIYVVSGHFALPLEWLHKEYEKIWFSHFKPNMDSVNHVLPGIKWGLFVKVVI